jgi:hypothetical protein
VIRSKRTTTVEIIPITPATKSCGLQSVAMVASLTVPVMIVDTMVSVVVAVVFVVKVLV